MVLSLKWCLDLQEKDDGFEWYEQGSKGSKTKILGMLMLGDWSCFKIVIR
jgi:hypothetical protein